MFAGALQKYSNRREDLGVAGLRRECRWPVGKAGPKLHVGVCLCPVRQETQVLHSRDPTEKSASRRHLGGQ